MTRFLPALLALLALPACEKGLVGYLVKQGFRQGSLMLRAEDIDAVLKRENLNARTEKFLRLSKDVVAYAEREVGMKTGRSYRRFISLDQDWVTQIVAAAPKERLTPHLFSFPIVGSVPYQGFFDEADAVAFEKNLQAQGFDTYRRKVEAFSSLGWLPDPLLSSMFSDEARLSETLFHELTHLNFYFESDADFNEAFASWMGFQVALAYADTAPSFLSDPKKVRAELERENAFHLKFSGAVKEILKKGKALYAEADPLGQRAGYFAWIHEYLAKEPLFKRVAALEWNNALILSLGTYYDYVPQIDAYSKHHGLSPKAFLALIMKRGPAIVPEIKAEAI